MGHGFANYPIYRREKPTMGKDSSHHAIDWLQAIISPFCLLDTNFVCLDSQLRMIRPQVQGWLRMTSPAVYWSNYTAPFPLSDYAHPKRNPGGMHTPDLGVYLFILSWGPFRGISTGFTPDFSGKHSKKSFRVDFPTSLSQSWFNMV